MSSDISFVAFIVSLVHTAYVHFGDVAEPGEQGAGQADLPAAQQIIDILAMLEEKTRGNLAAEERQVLEQALYELRLRYVQASEGAPRIIHP
jgi:hypothetical protein